MIPALYKGSTEVYILQIIPKKKKIDEEERAVLDIVYFGKDGRIFMDQATHFKVRSYEKGLSLATYKHYTEDVSIVSIVYLEQDLFCIFISEDRGIRIDDVKYFTIKTQAPKEKSRIIKPT